MFLNCYIGRITGLTRRDKSSSAIWRKAMAAMPCGSLTTTGDAGVASLANRGEQRDLAEQRCPQFFRRDEAAARAEQRMLVPSGVDEEAHVFRDAEGAAR